MAPKNKVDRPAAALSTMVVVSTVIAIFALLLASAAFHAARPGYEGSGRGLIQQVSARTPPQPRPILFTDWEIDRGEGETFWVERKVRESYLALNPDGLWVSASVRPEVLEKSEGYRGLEMEIFSGTDGWSDWEASLFLHYDGYWDEAFWLSPDRDRLRNSPEGLFDGEYWIIVESDGWVTVRLPLATERYGALTRVDLTVYRPGEVLVRNVNLVP